MANKKLIPLHDRVIIEPIEDNNITSGGIHIPDAAKEKSMSGIVRFFGPGSLTPEGKLLPLTVKVGDTVLFNKWSGTEAKVDGVTYIVIKESDILSIIEE